jgi:hypothetical protein
MKRNRLATFVFALAAAGAVHAESEPITANIPFEFTVGGKKLPAGNYSIRDLTSPGTVALQRRDGKGAVITLTQSESVKTYAAPQLIFHRYGARYFLSRVDFPSHRNTLPADKVERELAARVHRTGETIVAALR